MKPVFDELHVLLPSAWKCPQTHLQTMFYKQFYMIDSRLLKSVNFV